MERETVSVRWTWESGRIWANCSDGRRIPTWFADVRLVGLADLLNAAPQLSTRLLSAWHGVL